MATKFANILPDVMPVDVTQNVYEPIYPLVGDARIGTGSYGLPIMQQRMGTGDLFAYSPSFVENTTADLAEKLGGDYGARKLAGQVTEALEFLPGTGDIAAGTDAVHAFDQGRNVEGAVLSGLTALGTIPVVGPLIRRGGRSAMGYAARSADDTAALLNPKQQEILAAAEKQNPRFKEAVPYMHPAELIPIIDKRGGPDEMARLLEFLPSAANYAAVAKMGAPKKGWYQASAATIHDVFGTDAPRFASLLAATSPQNSVEMNLLNSLNIWKNWTAAGRPQDPAQIKAIMGQSVAGNKGQDSVLDAWVNNSTRALTSKDPVAVTLSGPKVDSFFRNLLGDTQRVTNDAHMANLSGISQDNLRVSPSDKQLAGGNPGMTPTYAAMAARQRQAGEQIGSTPAEVQEQAWSVSKPLIELQSSTGLPAREVLERGLLTPSAIRGTVDFSTLMNTGENAAILREAGYGGQLDNMRTFDFSADAPNLDLAEQAELSQAASRLENLGDLRLRESRAKQFQVGEVPRRAYVYQTEEAIPGRVTGHIPGLLDATPGAKQHFSSRVLGAFTDPQGMDILHRNLGMNTLATRPMQGAYRSSPDAPIEFNPGAAIGVEVPISAQRRIPKRTEQQLRTAATIRGGLLAQEGSPYSGIIPDPLGGDAFVTATKKLPRDQLEKYAAEFGIGDDAATAIVDYGQGAGILNWADRPFDDKQLEKIKDVLGERNKKGKNISDALAGRNVADENMSYVNLKPEFAQAPGSGSVSQRMVDEMNKLSAADFKRLDKKNVRVAAGDILKAYESKQKQGQPVREDLMNMLKIIEAKGLAGLRTAVKAKEFLPAIGAIGLLPTVFLNLGTGQDQT